MLVVVVVCCMQENLSPKHASGGCMLYCSIQQNRSPNAKDNVAMEWTNVSRMGQNYILPFGWDNFVPAIMFWDKFNSSMPRLITRKPIYKRRARNRHFHH
jgi:hypothetical protein